MRLHLLGLVWGTSITKQGKQLLYIENLSIMLMQPVKDVRRLEGKQVLVQVRYSGKGALFYGYQLWEYQPGGEANGIPWDELLMNQLTEVQNAH